MNKLITALLLASSCALALEQPITTPQKDPSTEQSSVKKEMAYYKKRAQIWGASEFLFASFLAFFPLVHAGAKRAFPIVARFFGANVVARINKAQSLTAETGHEDPSLDQARFLRTVHNETYQDYTNFLNAIELHKTGIKTGLFVACAFCFIPACYYAHKYRQLQKEVADAEQREQA